LPKAVDSNRELEYCGNYEFIIRLD